MSLCINPSCPKPKNAENQLFCQACGSELLLAGRYRVTHLLSDKGGFGNTYQVIHHNTFQVLKVLTNNHPKAVELFEQEARVLSQLNHRGIPKGEGDFTYFPRNSQNPLHCLVMEKIEGMDLEEYQKHRENRPIDQKLALEWLTQLAEILHEVHGHNFFHRDIKPSNIILRADGQLVLIDFGAVRQVTATIMAGAQNTGIYTPGYAPPEQEKGYAVPQSDFYALGRTFVYLLTGKAPTD
ncbi:MAG: serine/threonine protein kinase, partial [Xenococcaceae cyanobacterium]